MIIMFTAKSLFSCLKSDITINFCQRKSSLQTRQVLVEAESCLVHPLTIQSFVKDVVKKNLKSVTAQIIKSGLYNSNDICRVEQGSKKVKRSKGKSWKKGGKMAEQSPKHHKTSGESSHGRPKRQRPNYLIAVQVTDPKVLGNAKRIQDGILQQSTTDLKHMEVDVRKSHITLMVMYLSDSSAVGRAIHCLDQSIPTLKEYTDDGTTTLDFEGLSTFNGGSVLFVTIKPSPALESLHSMSDLITKQMGESGIESLGKDFDPHMTLMKYRWEKQSRRSAKKVEKNAYVDFEKEFLGSQRIFSVQLCRMDSEREDGYYVVEHEISLQE